jgi:hypothetical protein
MILKRHTLDGIASGRITLVFRCWMRPTVVAGGRLRTAAGELSIEAVDRIALADISAPDARRAGYGSLEELHVELARRATGELYRIRLGPLRPDPRVALRESADLGDADVLQLQGRLARMDRAASGGAWTMRSLEVIAGSPGVRAADLCRKLGQDIHDFKRHVRKLKELGLTESLEVGYRLSPRGCAFLRSR